MPTVYYTRSHQLKFSQSTHLLEVYNIFVYYYVCFRNETLFSIPINFLLCVHNQLLGSEVTIDLGGDDVPESPALIFSLLGIETNNIIIIIIIDKKYLTNSKIKIAGTISVEADYTIELDSKDKHSNLRGYWVSKKKNC
jgi:hypothetical protein